MKKRMQKGSLTVEASVLIPFLIFVVFVFICLCHYLHDRSVLSSCAAELSGKGAAGKYQSEKELEAWLLGQAAGLARGKLLALRELEVSVKVTKQKVVVAYEGYTSLLGGLRVREQEEARRMNPAAEIRREHQMGRAWKGMGKIR